tara:strand:- start:629 stop:877 length:249 start_codon:yes stop_codon:yes gene_type:complete
LTAYKEEVRKTIFVKAIRDTYINQMSNMDNETFIPEGTMMFHIVKDNKYLDKDEIGVWTPEHKTCYGYRPDWVSERTISDPN